MLTNNHVQGEPEPSHVEVRVALIDDAPVTAAIFWRWMRSPRRVTRVQIRQYHAEKPQINFIAFNRALPQGCRTLDEALGWLKGIVADLAHPGYAAIWGCMFEFRRI